MNIRGITNAVRARLLTDTGTGGLFNVGTPLVKAAYHEFGPDESDPDFATNAPYIVFRVVAADQQDGFATDLISYDIEFHVIGLVANGADPLLKAQDRIYGDAIENADRLPLYGFHRHNLVETVTGDADAPWAASPGMFHLGFTTAHDGKCFDYVTTYRVFASRVKV